MEFKKYQHIERLGNEEVEDILIGDCYFFPKLDGTNSSVWVDEDNNIRCGSRNREISIENDNHGFAKYISENEQIKKYLLDHKNHILYGEWLVPHSLKTYRTSAWNIFYIFDIIQKIDEHYRYISYDDYKDTLENYGLAYIPCINKIKNAKEEDILRVLNNNTFLIQDNCGIGEGIVIKNYSYLNKYGRMTWAKVVTNEFKEKHNREMRHSEDSSKLSIEEKIVENFCTISLIEKTFQKIRNKYDGWNSKYIPELLNSIYHDFIVEESWNFIKKYKNPKIDYKFMLKIVNQKIKEVKGDLF